MRLHRSLKNMLVLRNSSIAPLFLMLGLPVFAQSDVTTEGSLTPGRVVRAQKPGPPCWKQAGMTPDMVNQRWKLEDQQKVKVAQVCAEPSTSPQQRHDK